MDNSKREVWKVLKVAIFLFASIVIILPYLVQISTYFHERAHQKILSRYGVNNYYDANLVTTIPDFFVPESEALGTTSFNFGQYAEMDKYQKIELHTSGVISDLWFLFFISLLLVFLNVGIYIFYRIRTWLKEDVRVVINKVFMWGLALNWLLFIWLLSLIQITIANVTYPTGDIYQIIGFMKP